MVLCYGCAPLTQLQDPSTSTAGKKGEAGEQSGALEAYLQRKKLQADSSAVAPQYIAVLPFRDTSGFRQGVWDLESEMARMFSARLAAYPLPNWRVVPYAAVAEVVGKPKKMKLEQLLEFNRALKADMIVLGTLKDYDLKRVSVGDPLLGGYKSYTGVSEMDVQAIWIRDQKEAGMASASREIIDRDLGLDLLGKPREQDLQFLGLKDITFGSEEFIATPIGQATVEVMDELVLKLEELIRPSGLKLGNQPAEILSVYEEEIYINLGSENRLRTGFRFEIYPGPARAIEENLDTLQPIGALEVQEIIGARLSKVRVLQGHDLIRAGDRLKLLDAGP
jgi:hypothetical protein